MKTLTRSLIALLAVALPALTASADPLSGQIRKFEQLPLRGEPYYGHDEPSTAYASLDPVNPDVLGKYQGQFMADDFADLVDIPVVHVTWWGSYLQRDSSQPVDKFLIAWETDVPVSTDNPWSHPGTVLQWEIVTRGALLPGSGTFAEIPEPAGTSGPPLFESLYRYNAELKLPFAQKHDTVYWLKIVALVDVLPGTAPSTVWGWHDRDWAISDPLASVPPAVSPGEHIQGFVADAAGITAPVWHFQDDAVSGQIWFDPTDATTPNIVQELRGPENYISFLPDGLGPIDGPDGIEQYSKDLAFVLWTVPEPTTAVLLAVGALAMAYRRRRA